MQEVLFVLRLATSDWPAFSAVASPPFLDYFSKEFVFNVAKYLVINRSFKNQELLETSNAMLVECLRFFLQQPLSYKLLEMLRYLLDPVRSYFKINDQDLSNSVLPTMANSAAFRDSSFHKAFIEGLQVGQAVDCLKTDHEYKKSVWAKATVTKVKRGMVCVQFSDETEKWVDYKQTLEIMPAGQEVSEQDLEWRQNLQVGQEIDGLDTEHLWYNSLVLQTKTLPDSEEL